MKERVISRDEELASVFKDTLPLIHATLVSYYRLIEEEAQAFEETLSVWFRRLCQRLANSTPTEYLREQLVFVACKYARAFQISRMRGNGPQGNEFAAALARPPEEVAFDMVGELRRKEKPA